MQNAEVKVLLGGKMRHTGNERLLKRAIIGPFRQGSVHICVVYFWLAMRIFRHGPTLPRHPRVEDPQDEVKDAMIAQFTLGSTLGHRERREDKCGELALRELDRNRRRCRLCCRGAHQARAS
jgi:hypothetical protein